MPLLGGFNRLLFGLGVALTPVNMTIVIVGLILGTAIGVLPGLGGTNGVALLLPLTFTLQPTSAIILLASVYWGAIFGGAITSILFNIPGEPWSVATTFDGHPLAKQGKPGAALTPAFTSSFIGALVAIILFTFFALPLVLLGTPRPTSAAVMLAGFFIWGFSPGPLLCQTQRDFVWGLIGSMYIANVIGVIMVLTLVPVFAAINRIPFGILAPLIVIMSSIGAYATNNQILDLWFMLGSGVAGYLFKKLGYPLAPLVVALVLGDMTEQALRQSLIMGQGSLAIFSH